MKREQGVIQFILLALLGILLIAGVVVAVVLGLDQQFEGNTGQSMFNKDAKIHDIRARIRDAQEDLHENNEERRRENEAKSAPSEILLPKPADSSASASGDRLDQLSDRLKTSR